MSPWGMMEECGIPSIYLHSAAVQFADRLAARGQRVPDLAFAGGFSAEDQVFKAIALGSPYVKAVCMDRALMIPGMVGKNVGLWMADGGLPATVSQHGQTLPEIFVCWEEVANIVGKDEMAKIPLGAIGIYSYAQKLSGGLQRLMAGAGCFNISSISRRDLMSLTRECADVTGIPYLMDADREEAEAILDS
jgi:glutamate synthase domain-containing protein 2